MRYSKFEILRILAIMGVIILHYNAILLDYVFENSINKEMIYFTESMCICSVNIFILISGYFMCQSKKQTLWKPIELWFQVIVFNIVMSLLSMAMNGGGSLSQLCKALLPINYFVNLYVVLYIISPYLNCLINRLSIKQLRRMVFTSFILFSIWPILQDILEAIVGVKLIGLSSIGAYGAQSGYTIVNFAMMYLIGAWIGKDNIYLSRKTLLVFLASVYTILFLWIRVSWSTATEYCNPVVIISAIVIFLLFQSTNIKDSNIINGLAQASFTVFLLHSYFLPYAGIDKVANLSLDVLIVHLAITCIAIYIISYLIYIIYVKATSSFFKSLKKHIILPQIKILREKD